MPFPIERPRRLRRNARIRSLVRETRLTRDRLIYPLFAVPGKGVDQEIAGFPGVRHLSVDRLVEECRRAHGAGIPAVLLFGLPESKDPDGSGAWIENGIVQQACRAIREAKLD